MCRNRIEGGRVYVRRVCRKENVTDDGASKVSFHLPTNFNVSKEGKRT